MSHVLEGPRRVGCVWICAVVATGVQVVARNGGYRGVGVKTPVAVAVFDGKTLLAFEKDGTPMSETALDGLYPGSPARLRAAAVASA
ncbi:hypothetical protein [Antarctobacter sp.]|uniref:hypothetical protein n=1 Tax=Antarctobacter sp. TaxID=1872577 RepID=UPI002B2681FA|nr:hypothetical protein [Antarctobacter sp.]